MNDTKTSDKEALKRLRETRKHLIEQARTIVKKQSKTIQAIRGAIEKGPGTVPEIAGATGLSTAEVLLYVATLKKYGMVTEGTKDGDYFRYELTGE